VFYTLLLLKRYGPIGNLASFRLLDRKYPRENHYRTFCSRGEMQVAIIDFSAISMSFIWQSTQTRSLPWILSPRDHPCISVSYQYRANLARKKAADCRVSVRERPRNSMVERDARKEGQNCRK